MVHQLITSPDLDQAPIVRAMQSCGLEVRPTDTFEDLQPGNEEILVATSDSGHGAVRLIGAAREVSPDSRVVLACPRPAERDRIALLETGLVEIVEPAGLEPRHIAARFLSVLLPRSCRETTFCGMVAVSHCMRELFTNIKRIAELTDPVLIIGETGVGKELVAKALHTTGRDGHPWVAMNIAASTEQMVGSDLFGHVAGAFTGADRNREGLLSEAGHGSILLDEVGDLDSRSQIKLLRLLEERSYRPIGGNREKSLAARVVLATHKDLEKLVDEGAFRQDLYERIRGLELRVPPLRERMEDLPLLAEHLLKELNDEFDRDPRHHLSTMSTDILFRSSWPGNVRELRSALRRAAALSSSSDGSVSISVLRDCIKRRRPVAAELDRIAFDPEREVLAEAEGRLRRAFLNRAMELSGNKVATAAKLAGLSRARFYELLKELGIQY